MESGKLYISTDEDNNSVVIFKPTNNTVWLTQHEIASLFGVYTQTIGNNLRAIFKLGVIREEDVSYNQQYTASSGKYRERQVVYYNLDAIIVLAYRIKSKNAEVLRKWLIERTCKGQESQSVVAFRYDFDRISLNEKRF